MFHRYCDEMLLSISDSFSDSRRYIRRTPESHSDTTFLSPTTTRTENPILFPPFVFWTHGSPVQLFLEFLWCSLVRSMLKSHIFTLLLLKSCARRTKRACKYLYRSMIFKPPRSNTAFVILSVFICSNSFSKRLGMELIFPAPTSEKKVIPFTSSISWACRCLLDRNTAIRGTDAVPLTRERKCVHVVFAVMFFAFHSFPPILILRHRYSLQLLLLFLLSSVYVHLLYFIPFPLYGSGFFTSRIEAAV